MSTWLRYFHNGTALVIPGRTDIGIGGRALRNALVPGVVKPSAANTGLISGITRTPYTGPTTITTPTTITDKDITASLDIRADVTLDNCRITGTAGASYIISTSSAPNNCNVQVLNCEVYPTTPSHNYNAIQGHGLTVKWCNIHDTVDGVNLFLASTANNSVIQMNWIHDMAYFSPDSNHSDNQSHNDGVQIQGSKGPILIQGNFIDARGYSQVSGNTDILPDRGTGTDANGRHSWGALTCIQFTDAPTNVYTVSAAGSLVEVKDNWLYGGHRALSAGSADSNLGQWWRNRFDDTQGLRVGSSLLAKTGQTILVDALVTVDTGDGTANANVYDFDGTEVSVHHNG